MSYGPNALPLFERLETADRARAASGPAPASAVCVVRGDRDHYYALLGSRWLRWPARADGWAARAGVDPPRDPIPLAPRPARLALRLSGAPPDPR
jgi:hypothetical protein